MQIHMQSDLSFLLHELSSQLLKAGYARPWLDFTHCQAFEIQCGLGVSEQELDAFLQCISPLHPPVKRDITNYKKELTLFIGDQYKLTEWDIVLNAPQSTLVQPLEQQLEQLGIQQVNYKRARPPHAVLKYGGASLFIRQLLTWLCAQQSISITCEQVWDQQSKELWLYLPVPIESLTQIKNKYPICLMSDDEELARDYGDMLLQQGYTQVAIYVSQELLDGFECYWSLLNHYPDEVEGLQKQLTQFLQQHSVDLTQYQLTQLDEQQAHIRWQSFQKNSQFIDSMNLSDLSVSSSSLNTSPPISQPKPHELDTIPSYVVLPLHAYQQQKIYPQKGDDPKRWSIDIHCDHARIAQKIKKQLQDKGFTRIDIHVLAPQKESDALQIHWGSAAAYKHIVTTIMSIVSQVGTFPFVIHKPYEALEGLGSDQESNQICIHLCAQDLHMKSWLKKIQNIGKQTHLNLVMNVSDLHPLASALRALPLSSFTLINPQEYLENHGYHDVHAMSPNWNDHTFNSSLISSQDQSDSSHSEIAHLYPLTDDSSQSTQDTHTSYVKDYLRETWKSMGGLSTAIPDSEQVCIRYGGAHITLIHYIQQLIIHHSAYNHEDVILMPCWSEDDQDIVVEFPIHVHSDHISNQWEKLDWNEWFIFGPNRYKSLEFIRLDSDESKLYIADLTLELSKSVRSHEILLTESTHKEADELMTASSSLLSSAPSHSSDSYFHPLAYIPHLNSHDTFIDHQQANHLYHMAQCVKYQQACFVQGVSGSGKTKLILFLAHHMQQSVIQCFAHEITLEILTQCIQENIWLIIQEVQYISIEIQATLARTFAHSPHPFMAFLCTSLTEEQWNQSHFYYPTWFHPLYRIYIPYQKELDHYESVLSYLVFAEPKEIFFLAKHYQLPVADRAMYYKISSLIHIKVFLKALAALHYGSEELKQHGKLNYLKPYWHAFHAILSSMSQHIQRDDHDLTMISQSKEKHRQYSYTIMRTALKQHYLDPIADALQKRMVMELLEQLGIGLIRWDLEYEMKE